MNRNWTLENLLGRLTASLWFGFWLSAVLGFSSYAFPIQPVPLRQLIANSDLIIWAQVQPEPASTRRSSFLTASISVMPPARLGVKSVLKGVPPSNPVKVAFDSGLVCPSPPRFPAGSNVLAFLDLDTKTGEFKTAALDYGAKLISSQAFASYSPRIREMVQIANEPEVKIRTRKTVEWLVRCCEESPTRWEGASELAEGMNFGGVGEKSNPLANELSASQLARLSNILFSAEYVTDCHLSLAQLFKDRSKKKVVRFLLDYLRRAAKPVPPPFDGLPDMDSLPEPWIVYDVMGALVGLVPDAAANVDLAKNKRTDFFNVSQRIQRINRFLPLAEAAARRKGYL